MPTDLDAAILAERDRAVKLLRDLADLLERQKVARLCDVLPLVAGPVQEIEQRAVAIGLRYPVQDCQLTCEVPPCDVGPPYGVKRNGE